MSVSKTNHTISTSPQTHTTAVNQRKTSTTIILNKNKPKDRIRPKDRTVHLGNASCSWSERSSSQR